MPASAWAARDWKRGLRHVGSTVANRSTGASLAMARARAMARWRPGVMSSTVPSASAISSY